MTSATEKLRQLPNERGTLTAKQVRKAIEANSWAETSRIREFSDSSWQEIADELNAELGRGTCELEPTFIRPTNLDGSWQEWTCSKCGEFTYLDTMDEDERPNFCSHCGAKVVRS